jgi:hypothetical protein
MLVIVFFSSAISYLRKKFYCVRIFYIRVLYLTPPIQQQEFKAQDTLSLSRRQEGENRNPRGLREKTGREIRGGKNRRGEPRVEIYIPDRKLFGPCLRAFQGAGFNGWN